MFDRYGLPVREGDVVAFACSTKGVPDMVLGEVIEVGEFKRTYSKGLAVKIQPIMTDERYCGITNRVAIRFKREIVKVK